MTQPNPNEDRDQGWVESRSYSPGYCHGYTYDAPRYESLHELTRAAAAAPVGNYTYDVFDQTRTCLTTVSLGTCVRFMYDTSCLGSVPEVEADVPLIVVTRPS